MDEQRRDAPGIYAGGWRCVPLGGATTAWQLQRLTARKKDGSLYWQPVDRYPGSLQAACETLFEMAGAQVPGRDFGELLRGLAVLKDEICETCRACCAAMDEGRRQ